MTLQKICSSLASSVFAVILAIVHIVNDEILYKKIILIGIL